MTIGFAMCGSFCTFSQVFPVMEKLAETYDIIPIFSPAACTINSRFGTAASHIQRATEICGVTPISSIQEAEPIGPKKLLDALVIAPCTGNTLSKLAHSVADTAVTMAAKAHLRNGKPLIIALASNDGLSANLRNIGTLLARKQVYFVPLGQDDPVSKPHSLVCDFEKIPETLKAALQGKQIQPLLV